MKFKRSIQIFTTTLAILGAVAGLGTAARAQAQTPATGGSEGGAISNTAPNGGGPAVVPPSTTVNSTPGIPPLPQAVDDSTAGTVPVSGSGTAVAATSDATTTTRKATNLPNTGGEPLVVMLSGLSMASGAFLLRRKLV